MNALMNRRKRYRDRAGEVQALLTKLEEVNSVVRELQEARRDTDGSAQTLEAK
jgi:hypothetical protein